METPHRCCCESIVKPALEKCNLVLKARGHQGLGFHFVGQELVDVRQVGLLDSEFLG
jgi:hypothetical protein